MATTPATRPEAEPSKMPTEKSQAVPPARRTRKRPTPAERADQVELACKIVEALAKMEPCPAVADLAASLRRRVAELEPALAAMEKAGMIERWTEFGPPDSPRVMLSMRALARLGLRLDPRGDRWNPDRAPAPSPRGGSPRAVDHVSDQAVIVGH